MRVGEHTLAQDPDCREQKDFCLPEFQSLRIEKVIQNILPSRQFGFIVMTTTYGIMDHESARKKHTGGKLLGFFY